MLTEITGDLLKIENGIICHQVNYHGAMGGGVAAAIAENILTDEQYEAYVDYCKENGPDALGTVQFTGEEDGLIVANMFCQDEELATPGKRNQNITDYEAMGKCLVRVRTMAIRLGKRVYFPCNMGCGIAGGSWDAVLYLLRDLFAEYPVEAYIVGRPGK